MTTEEALQTTTASRRPRRKAAKAEVRAERWEARSEAVAAVVERLPALPKMWEAALGSAVAIGAAAVLVYLPGVLT